MELAVTQAANDKEHVAPSWRQPVKTHNSANGVKMASPGGSSQESVSPAVHPEIKLASVHGLDSEIRRFRPVISLALLPISGLILVLETIHNHCLKNRALLFCLLVPTLALAIKLFA